MIRPIDFEDILIPIALFAMVVLIVYFVVRSHHAERMELIKHGINPAKYKIHVPGKGVLVWGILFLALGIGGIVALMLVHYPAAGEEKFSTVFLSVAGILAGIGFIIYWIISAPERERALKMREQMMANLPNPQLNPEPKASDQNSF